MSMVTFKAKQEVEAHKEKFPEHYLREAQQRVDAREHPPVTDEEKAMALRSEINSVFYDEVKERSREIWVEMFMGVFNEASDSYRDELESAMLEAFRRTHRYDQNEVFNRLIAFFNNVAKSEPGHFDDRNRWIKNAAARFFFAAMHPQEMDTLMDMDDNQLRDLRLRAPKKEGV